MVPLPSEVWVIGDHTPGHTPGPDPVGLRVVHPRVLLEIGKDLARVGVGWKTQIKEPIEVRLTHRSGWGPKQLVHGGFLQDGAHG